MGAIGFLFHAICLSQSTLVLSTWGWSEQGAGADSAAQGSETGPAYVPCCVLPEPKA